MDGSSTIVRVQVVDDFMTLTIITVPFIVMARVTYVHHYVRTSPITLQV
jgi:dolichyl-phosphate-mannose--protein O-mannosyl transferase